MGPWGAQRPLPPSATSVCASPSPHQDVRLSVCPVGPPSPPGCSVSPQCRPPALISLSLSFCSSPPPLFLLFPPPHPTHAVSLLSPSALCCVFVSFSLSSLIVHGGKGVRFTLSEEIYPEKGTCTAHSPQHPSASPPEMCPPPLPASQGRFGLNWGEFGGIDPFPVPTAWGWGVSSGHPGAAAGGGGTHNPFPPTLLP